MNESERISKGQVFAKVIIEMLGAPKEHIEGTLKKYIEKLKKESKSYEIMNADFVEATPQGRFFSAFTELDIWFNKPIDLINFCFDSMPSSVDIMRPDDLSISAKALTDLVNDMQARLHEIDMVVKKVKAENKLLDSNSTAVFRNFIMYVLKQGEKSLEELGECMGVVGKELKPFMDKLISQGAAEEKDGKYYAREKGKKKGSKE